LNGKPAAPSLEDVFIDLMGNARTISGERARPARAGFFRRVGAMLLKELLQLRRDG